MRISTRIWRIRRRILVIALIALSMLAAACGSDNGDSNASASEASSSATEAEGGALQSEQEGPPPASEPPAPADEPTAADAVDPEAAKVATSFVEAYGAFDIERALSYLADDAFIDGIGETFEEVQLGASWFEAMGYEQMLSSCEAQASSVAGTVFRCPYDFHLLRSDEIGLGPYSGSHFDLTVEDGAIVRVSQQLNYIEEFSGQMWEPFADWVSATYPEDAEVMYTDETLTMGQFTEKSFKLWDERSREYAEEVGQAATPSEAAS